MKRQQEQDERTATSEQETSSSHEGLGAFMTVEDVADMLRINKSTVYRMAKAGRIPATRVGRQWRFRLSALEEFLDAGGDRAFTQQEQERQGQQQGQGLRKAVNRW